MPRAGWATDQQSSWLGQGKKAFGDAQAESATRAWLNARTETFADKWPLPPPTDAELAEHNGNYAAAMDAAYKRLRNQIEWWYRNRARANATGRSANKKTAVLPLVRRRTQPLLPYQAYMHLYSERVMPLIKVNYAAYKAGLPADQEPREWWGFATAEASRLLQTEPEDIKDVVEAYRQLQAQSSKPSVFDLDHLTKEGAEAATKKVRDLQQNVKRLARTAFEACKAIEEQTGWKASMFLGGPNPETGKLLTLTVHNGRTVDLQNLFSDATEHWSTIQAEWDTFIARSYKPDLAPKLERFFNGEVDDSDLPPLADVDSTDAEADVTPAPPASSASSSDVSPAEPESTAAPGTVSAADASSSESTTASPPTKKPSDNLAYFHQCQANIARNAEILKRVLNGEQYEDIVRALDLKKTAAAGGDGEEEEEVVVPAWIEKAREYLEGVSEEKWWRELVTAWLDFERELRYPDGQAQANWLSPKARPEEVKYWIARGRKYDRPPKVKSLPAFVAQFRQWWARIQPSVRRDPEELWPLLKNVPEADADWSDVKRGGCNGVFMVLMCLSWWLFAAEDDEDYEDLREAVDDVHWVLRTLVPPKLSAPTSSDSAATATETASETTAPPETSTAPTTEAAAVVAAAVVVIL